MIIEIFLILLISPPLCVHPCVCTPYRTDPRRDAPFGRLYTDPADNIQGIRHLNSQLSTLN
jgi:hypothetical protein